ncbi:MAG: hypothetical protein AAGF26_11470 [Cyanobacteria bacterium P01_G01_bin.49]
MITNSPSAHFCVGKAFSTLSAIVTPYSSRFDWLISDRDGTVPTIFFSEALTLGLIENLELPI